MTSLITSSLNFCVLQKRLWRLCFSPKVRLFQRFSKTLRNCTCIAQRSFPRKVLVPINTRGAPLTPGSRGSLHTLFILWPVQGHLSFVFCISKPEQRLELLCAPAAPAPRRSGLSLSGELPRCCSGLRSQWALSPPLHMCSSLSSACVFASRFPVSQKASTLLKCNVAPWVERSDH